MKKILLLMLLLITTLLLSQPKIEFESREYNFGEIEEAGGPYIHEFKFTNVGNEPLQIDRVKAG